MRHLVYLCALFSVSAFAAGESFVSVRGEGEVKIKPDLATVHLQVNSKGKEAQSAQEKNAKEMARVMKALKSNFGVEEKDLQTSGFSVNPDYRYEQTTGKQIFQGYQVAHSLMVTVRKLENLGSILDGVVGKGGEEAGVSLNQVSFDTSKRKDIEVKALEAAMENAHNRAEALAKFAKRSLKAVRRISDSSVQQSRPIFGGMAEMAMAGTARMDKTTVAAGEISVTSQVSVDYDLD